MSPVVSGGGSAVHSVDMHSVDVCRTQLYLHNAGYKLCRSVGLTWMDHSYRATVRHVLPSETWVKGGFCQCMERGKAGRKRVHATG